MKYCEYLDHHSENYDPEKLYKGEDYNDLMIEKALSELDNK